MAGGAAGAAWMWCRLSTWKKIMGWCAQAGKSGTMCKNATAPSKNATAKKDRSSKVRSSQVRSPSEIERAKLPQRTKKQSVSRRVIWYAMSRGLSDYAIVETFWCVAPPGDAMAPSWLRDGAKFVTRWHQVSYATVPQLARNLLQMKATQALSMAFRLSNFLAEGASDHGAQGNTSNQLGI